MLGTMPNARTLTVIFAALVMSVTLVANSHAGLFDKSGPNVKRDVASYEEEGKDWGEKLRDRDIRANSDLNNSTSEDFIEHLIEKDEIDYFGVHNDLKEAFKKGFRNGFQDRTADLVLGPHLEKAAGIIGKRTASDFVKVIDDFETGWAVTLNKAINIFITLIAEGSQADRERFIGNFIDVYRNKYESNQSIIKAGESVPFKSEGGTQLYFNSGRVKSTLDIPSDKALKTEIYEQTFKVMGDEMGRRYSHNLISRTDLIEWLRRSKSALSMDSGTIDAKLVAKNLGIIKDAFSAPTSYGTDGKNVFDGIAKEAGY